MKKILLSLALGISLFAYTETSHPDRIDVEIEKNNDMKLLIDCSYKKPRFYQKVNINDLLESICSNTQGTSFEIKYSDFNKKLHDFYDNYGFKILDEDTKITYLNNYIDYKSLEELKEQKLYYHINLYKSFLFSKDDVIVMEIPITSLTNAFIKIDYSFSLGKSRSSFYLYEKYLIKNYKYNKTNNKIELFEIDRPFINNSNKTFTNNYNIDDVSECINGDVWIKKYSAMNGDKCKWLEK